MSVDYNMDQYRKKRPETETNALHNTIFPSNPALRLCRKVLEKSFSNVKNSQLALPYTKPSKLLASKNRTAQITSGFHINTFIISQAI